MSSKGKLRHLAPVALAAVAIAAAVWQPWTTSAAAGEAVVIPAPAVDTQPGPRTAEVAVLAGGCFWGVQGVFQHVEGVTLAVSGYAGGDADSANYQMVGRGTTGHAESVEITFDRSKISYGKILQIYFSVAHDPTQFNYQGPDIGPQYRSAIFPTSEEQARVAKAYIAQLDQAQVYGDAIVTTIEPGQSFHPAEDYHQDYLTLNPTSPYIVIHDLPKIRNLERMFPELYREEPVLVMAGKPSN